MDNPFDRLGLSPLATVDEITNALRERAEDASDEERRMLRESWEELTMHPRARVRAALLTFVPRADAKEPRPAPLSASLKPSPPPDDPLAGISAVDLLPRPSIGAALVSGTRGAAPPSALPPLEDDPIVQRALAAVTRRSAS